MSWERKSEDGFNGKYPKPLDWDAIEAELIAKSRPTEAGERSDEPEQ